MAARGPFLTDKQGVSAIEFALVTPILLIIMLMGLQLITYVNAVRRVTQLTASIVQMITQAAPTTPGASTATVNELDITFSAESSFVIFPYLLKDAVQRGLPWYADISINYASVSFAKKNGLTCAVVDLSACYDASVVWTSSGFYANARPCSPKQQPMSDSGAPNPAYLPKSTFGPGSLIVVDVVFTFRPTFAQNLIPPLTISRSAYVQPRYVSLINFDTTNSSGIIKKCPGF